MTEDTRRNKLELENHFYLELIHKYNGDFESILSPLELSVWNQFPDFHKRFFSLHYNWEFLAKRSLNLFNQTEGCTNPMSASEQAKIIMQAHYYTRTSKETTLSTPDLSNFLLPLLYLKDSSLTQRIAEALYYHTDDPEEAKKRYSIEWQSNEALTYPIPFAWLKKQNDKYLQECSYVWQRYLSENHSIGKTKTKINNEFSSVSEIRSSTNIQRYFILLEMSEYGIDSKAVKRGEKANYRRAFCTKYKISEAVFDDRWKELCKAGEVYSLHQPRQKSTK